MFGIRELTTKLVNKEISAVEVAEYFNKIIKNSKLNSFITPSPELSLEQARQIDNKIKQDLRLGKLAGVPVAVKDIIVTSGLRSTGGSKILDNYVPGYNATVVEKIIGEDAVITGKTNCDEFAMGSSGENSGYGPTKNPWDLACVPGGSSSGSAAAVAAGESLAALGTDTGGSIRQPASFCGLVGLKPTYGRVSRYGLMAMTSSFDQAGPITRTVEDAAYILEAIAGQDQRDATSSGTSAANYVADLPLDINGLRLGIPAEFFSTGLEPAVKAVVEKAIKKLESLGAKTIEVNLPSVSYALAAYYVICPSEVSANLSRYDGIRFGTRASEKSLDDLYKQTRGKLLGPEVKRRIMLGTYVLSAGYYDAYYRRAQLARQVIKNEFNEIFKKVDLLVSPTTPTTAFVLGSKVNDPLAMYLGDIYTVPVNIAGLPAVSVPCGFVDNLPVGLQLIGPAWSEDKLLRTAYKYEQSEEWHKKTPPGVTLKY